MEDSRMNILISVFDKTNLLKFASGLIELGHHIFSTGGTYNYLKKNTISATSIQDITQFDEILDGRVKTLHPKIFGGILSNRDIDTHIDTCKNYKIPPIDLVVVNLYPFEETASNLLSSHEDIIEKIDIGGVSLIRAAAKNYAHVGVVTSPEQYDDILNELKAKHHLSKTQRLKLASQAFKISQHYDKAIFDYLSKLETSTLNANSSLTKPHQEAGNHFPDTLTLRLQKKTSLRYGENPHQKASLYLHDMTAFSQFKQLHGKELSYNNILDMNAAIHTAFSFNKPCAVIVKHTVPCGVALAETLLSAYKLALSTDKESAFGSIIGLNKPVDLELAQELAQLFIEVIIAPSFSENAISLLSQKASIRLITVPKTIPYPLSYTHINGLFLVQDTDRFSYEHFVDYTIVTKAVPSEKTIQDLLFANQIAKFMKSNAIIIAKNQQSIGLGSGQTSRVKAVEIALKQAKNCENAVVASDAFFPFKDSVELLAQAGIQAIIQPGGSKRDQESIDACNKNNISMLFTKNRHFLH